MICSAPFSRYFQRLDFMVHKHIPKIYQLFKSLGIKNFGQPPPSFDPLKKRGFTTWRKIQELGYYQGELDHQGQPDGMGVAVMPNNAMRIGYHNDEQDESYGIQIFEGSVMLGTWNNDIPYDVDVYYENAHGEKMFS